MKHRPSLSTRNFGIVPSVIVAVCLAGCSTYPQSKSPDIQLCAPRSFSPLSYHDEVILKDLAINIVDLTAGHLTSAQKALMKGDAMKPVTVFHSEFGDLFEFGGWRLYFSEYLNLRNVQYYPEARDGCLGLMIFADINNKQVFWGLYGEREGGRRCLSFLPKLAATANSYEILRITVSKFGRSESGADEILENIEIELKKEAPVVPVGDPERGKP